MRRSMHMKAHDFKVQTSWRGGRDTVGKVQGDVLHESISIPAGLGGQGVGTNPDEMLVSAASSCYIISLAAVLERAHYEDVEIAQTSIGTAVLDQGKFKMKSITHYPTITIHEDEATRLNRQLSKLLKLADQNCMISNSVRGNVEIDIEPNIRYLND